MTYVLVHGGGFGSAAWDRLLPFLPGHVLAVDLPGRGVRAEVDLADVTTQACAEAVVADMVAEDVQDAVLVGHSLAGVTIPRIMALAPERLRAAVLVSAIVPSHGEPVMTTMDPATRAAVEPALAAGVYSPGAGAGLEMLCNDLDAEQVEFVVRSRTDDSARLLSEPADLSGLTASVPRWYVHLTLDQRVPPALQDTCNVHWDGRRVTLATGHMAMVADPRGLAEILEAIRRDPRADRLGTSAMSADSAGNRAGLDT
jgi:pimeloyl-ACP methyl ester carboxylesterase